ncbi:hypothetical protein MIAR_21160 [Microbacterium arabinogalactanolyticum]|nr:hypothetical protein MIAR_21160 [Microbacterium arabinogalactanolyticum]
MPKNPQAAIQPRSRALGNRAFTITATTSKANAATSKRAKDNPMTPIAGAATLMAGKADAHSRTTDSPALKALLTLMTQE